MEIKDIKPTRGLILGKAIIGRYETESGILVVKDLKRNPKIEKVEVVEVGDSWYDKKGREKKCPAKVGETAYIRRAAFKHRRTEGVIEYSFIENANIVGMVGEDNQLRAPSNNVIVKPVYSSTAQGSKIFQVHDRDSRYIGEFYGIVESVGTECTLGITKGDKVLFRRHEGTPIDHDGVEYLSLASKWVEGKM